MAKLEHALRKPGGGTNCSVKTNYGLWEAWQSSTLLYVPSIAGARYGVPG